MVSISAATPVPVVASVITMGGRQSASLSDAGRKLFAVSRTAKRQPNDADRLKKYLARFGLSWDDVQA